MLKRDIVSYIENTCSEEERRAIIEWISEGSTNQKFYNKIKAEYVAAKLKEVATEKNDKVYTKAFKKRKSTKLFKIAAAAVILVSLGVLIKFQFLSGMTSGTTIAGENITNISTKRGDQYTLLLEDGTKVTLNSDSKITYPQKFGTSTREVILEGEAYFDVAHNPQKPFIVKTSNLDVKVLGTTFNIKSYSEDKTIQTTLVSGKVEVFEKENSAKLVLQPSQRATFNKKHNKITLDKVSTSDIISWKTGVLVFKETPFMEVLTDLERKYNVEFEVKSEKLLKYQYTGSFQDLKIEEILEILAISSPITIEKNTTNNKIQIFMR